VYLSASEKAARISAGMRAWHAARDLSPAAREALDAGRPLGPLAASQRAADRLQDYAWLLSFGEPPESAAARAGVSVQHARQVYEPLIAAMEECADAA
jgi:hypothetical protein